MSSPRTAHAERGFCYTRGVKLRRADCVSFLLFFLIAVPGMIAASQTPTAESSPSARQVTSLLEEHYKHLKTLRATFLERYNEGPQQSRVESGTVYFRRPGQMRWEYESPENKLFLSDGKMVWFYVPYDHTVTKTALKESSDWRTPLALLTGKVDLSRLCGAVDLVEQKGVSAGNVVLRCTPKGEKPQAPVTESGKRDLPQDANGEEEFTEVFLEVNSGSGELSRIEIRQPGGIELEYRFGGWQTDIPLAEGMFRFEVPRGVAIVNGAGLTGAPK